MTPLPLDSLPSPGAVADELDALDPELGPGDRPAASLYCPAPVHILVVDDEEPICRLVQATLARDEFQIDIVSEPEQVEAQLRSRPYHLIILDYNLPPLPAGAVFEWVRRDQPDAAVIIITGQPSMQSAVQSLRAHAFDYLTKPFQTAHLQQAVTRCLEGKGLLRMTVRALCEALGVAIRERRKALGLTLKELAQRTDVSLGYLSQIELGKNSASIDTLYKISLGLGIRLADLFQTVQPH